MKWTFVMAAVLTTLLACGNEEPDPMGEMLDSIVVSAEARDADAIRTHLSESYNDSTREGREGAARALRRLFDGYRTIDVDVSGIEIETRSTFIGAQFRVDFSGGSARSGGISDLLPSRSSYQFWIEIEKEKDVWKVVWAEWEEIESPGLVE